MLSHGCEYTHLPQLLRQITSGPIRPLYKSCVGQHSSSVSVCECSDELATLFITHVGAVLLYLDNINSGVVG